MKKNPFFYTANFISGLEEFSEPLYCHKIKNCPYLIYWDNNSLKKKWETNDYHKRNGHHTAATVTAVTDMVTVKWYG
jgi:hypothetical protein